MLLNFTLSGKIKPVSEWILFNFKAEFCCRILATNLSISNATTITIHTAYTGDAAKHMVTISLKHIAAGFARGWPMCAKQGANRPGLVHVLNKLWCLN